MKEQHFEEIVQASLEKSQVASKKRINTLFKNFDENAQEGYQVEDVDQMLEEDLKAIFALVKSRFSERKVGSERSMNFVEALKDRVPQLYSEMMTSYQQNQKKAATAKKKDEAKQLNKLDDEIEKLQEELEKLENGTYVDQSDEDEESDSEYDSEEDSDEREARKAKKRAKNIKAPKQQVPLNDQLVALQEEQKDLEIQTENRKEELEVLKTEV